MKADQILSRLRRGWRSLSELRWRILLLLLVVALASSLTATLLGSQEWDGLLLNFGTEMAGAVVTYVLLQMVIGTRTRKAELKANLIAQMGSDVRDVAVPAADELRRHGWLTDGSLRGADLEGAELQGASLWGADLQGADLRWTDLRAALHLETAKLDGAKANSETQWPEGFQVPDTVEMAED